MCTCLCMCTVNSPSNTAIHTAIHMVIHTVIHTVIHMVIHTVIYKVIHTAIHMVMHIVIHTVIHMAHTHAVILINKHFQTIIDESVWLSYRCFHFFDDAFYVNHRRHHQTRILIQMHQTRAPVGPNQM